MFQKFMLGITWLIAGVFICAVSTAICGLVYLMVEYGNAAEEFSNISLDDDVTATPRPATRTPEPTETFTPFEVMELVFEGYPSQREIHAALDPVMDRFGLIKTPDNYNGAAGALVALTGSSKTGVTEMEILKEMLLVSDEFTFVEAAAIAFTALEAGE